MDSLLPIAFYALAGILFVLGVVGCVVPALPGPLLAYAGVLCLFPTPRSPGVAGALWMGLATAVVTLLDFAVPGWGAKKFKSSKGGIWGSVAGTLVGLCFFPWGLLLGPFLGAIAGELLSGRRLDAAVWGGIGALLGFLCGVLLKLVFCFLLFAGVLLDWP